MSDDSKEPLVTHLKRAGEQVLGAKPLTGNDHVRLSALLKVAALEIEALCAARDDAAELRAAAEDALNAIGRQQRDPAYHSAYLLLQRAARRLRAALAASEGQP